jgi:hypothetical protein
MISDMDITKLKSAGFYTVESILHATKNKLLGVKGLSEGKVERLWVIAILLKCSCIPIYNMMCL